MRVPVCECERGRKRSTTSILQCEIPYLFAWVVSWMQTRKKASASCVSVWDSSLSSVCECKQGRKRSTTSILQCGIPSLFARVVSWMRRRKKASASCVSVRDSSLPRVSIISLILPVCRTRPQRFAKLSLHAHTFQIPVSGTETPSVVASKVPKLHISF